MRGREIERTRTIEEKERESELVCVAFELEGEANLLVVMVVWSSTREFKSRESQSHAVRGYACDQRREGGVIYKYNFIRVFYAKIPLFNYISDEKEILCNIQ